jgi:hypothetical protein
MVLAPCVHQSHVILPILFLPLLFVTGRRRLVRFVLWFSKIIVWFLNGRGACSDVSWIFVLMWDLLCVVT